MSVPGRTCRQVSLLLLSSSCLILSRVVCVMGSRSFLRDLLSTYRQPTTLKIFMRSSSLRHSRCLCMSRRISRSVLACALYSSYDHARPNS